MDNDLSSKVDAAERKFPKAVKVYMVIEKIRQPKYMKYISEIIIIYTRRQEGIYQIAEI